MFVNSGSEDQYEHVSSILINVTRVETGRKLMLDPKKGLLKQILPHSGSTSVVRQKGVSKIVDTVVLCS